MAPARILLVDDFDRWRRFISSIFENRSEFQIIGEVTDGENALEKAEELQPDLILLDVGLPKLNGIEAARRIRKAAPNSKILFLSATHSPEIAGEALGTGANGFVVKEDAGNELFPAVEAVLQDKTFVSARLVSRNAAHNGNCKLPSFQASE
jgi:DNA-binding NarL/FixJ family response regulator